MHAVPFWKAFLNTSLTTMRGKGFRNCKVAWWKPLGSQSRPAQVTSLAPLTHRRVTCAHGRRFRLNLPISGQSSKVFALCLCACNAQAVQSTKTNLSAVRPGCASEGLSLSTHRPHRLPGELRMTPKHAALRCRRSRCHSKLQIRNHKFLNRKQLTCLKGGH